MRVADLEAALYATSTIGPDLQAEGQQIDQFVGQANARAATIADPFAQAFNQVNASAQQSFQSATGAAVQATNEMSGLASQAAAPFVQAFGQMSASTQSALGSATAALRQIGTEGGISAQQLASSQVQVQAALGGVDAAIREESAALAEMIARQQSGRNVTATLNSEISRTQSILTGLTGEQTALRAASSQVNSELRNQAGVALQSSIGVTAAGTASTKAGEATGFWTNLLKTHTSQISTSGGPLKGYDAAVQAVARSMGGIPVVMALAISVGGALLSTFFKQKKGAEDLTIINKDLIASDIALAGAFYALAQASELTSAAGQKQVLIHLQLARSDFQAAIISAVNAYKEYAPAAEASANAESELSRVLAVNNRLQEQGVDVSKLHINEINRMEQALSGALSPAERQLYKDILLVHGSLFDLQQNVLTTTAAHGKLDETLNKATQTIVQFGQQSGMSTDQMIGMARSVAGTGAAFDEMSARIRNATSALASYNAQLASFKIPALDIKSTTEGLAKARTQINQTIGDLVAGGKAQSDVMVATKGSIDQYVKSVQGKIAADAAASGRTLTHKEATAQLRAELGKVPDNVNAYGGAVQKLDANLKAFSESTKKAGGGARVAHAAFNEFASGALGLDKAIEIVKAKLGDPALFAPVAKAAKAAMAETKAAFKEVADVVEEFFSSAGDKIKVTIERLARLTPEVGKPLIDLSQGFRNLKTAIEDLNFERAAKGLTTFDDDIKRTGKTIEIAFITFRALSADTISNAEKMGFTFKVVFPAMGLELGKFADTARDSMAEVGKAFEPSEEWTKKWIDGMQKMAGEAPHWAGATVDAANRIKNALENDVNLTIARAQVDQKQAIDSMIGDYERLAEQMGLNGQKFKDFVEQHIRQTLASVKDISKEEVERIVEIWKQELNKLPGIWESILGKLPSATKGVVNDVLGIIATMPGRVGDSLRKVESEFQKWLNFIDNIFGLIHKIFKGFPESIGDIVNKTGLIIKNVGQSFKNVSADISDVMQFASSESRAAFDAIANSAESGSSRTVQAIQGIIGGLAALGQIVGGRVGGALSGAAAGAAIGTAILPGIGTAIGAIGGAIAGFFGGGKSAHEKEMQRQQEEQGRLQIEALKKQLQKDTQEIAQAALQTIRDAMETFSQMSDYTKIGQKHIKAFFADLETVLKLFFNLASKFSADMLDKAKSFAKKIGPVLETVGVGVQALSLLGSYIPVAERIIVEFFRDLSRVVDRFGALAEEIPNKLLKHAKKLGNKLAPLAEVIGPFVEGFAKLFSFKTVPESALDAFADSLTRAMTRLGQIAEEIDRKMMKDAQRFSERAAAVVQLVALGVDAFLKMIDFKPVTMEAFDALYDGIKEAIRRMTDLVTSLDTEMLSRAEVVAAKSLAIFEAIKAAVETFSLLRDYKSITNEAIDALVNDFRQAIVALDKMIGFTDELQRKADLWRDAMLGVRATFEEGIEALRDVVRFASAALEGITQEAARGGGTTLGASAFAVAGGAGLRYATGGAGGASYTTSSFTVEKGAVQITVQAAPGMSDEEVEGVTSRIADRLIAAIKKKRG